MNNINKREARTGEKLQEPEEFLNKEIKSFNRGMGESDLEEFFLNTKPVKLLVRLRQRTSENYASALSKQIDATYSHTVKVLQQMKEFGLVEFNRKGRKKEVDLTEEGEKLAELFHRLIRKL